MDSFDDEVILIRLNCFTYSIDFFHYELKSITSTNIQLLFPQLIFPYHIDKKLTTNNYWLTCTPEIKETI